MFETKPLFVAAAQIDPSLKAGTAEIAELGSIQIRANKYKRETLFGNMSRGRVSLFHDFPAPVHHPHAGGRGVINPILQRLELTRLDGKIRTQVGPKNQVRYLSPCELAHRWRQNQTPVNVTDFHIRGTALEEVIKTSALSQFNFLPGMSDNVAWIEMMTMVLSTKGGFSDSHSDDCDGSNHCFSGKKLWLAWDTAEGLAAGLQDLDQQRIVGRCKFKLRTFLKLQSACWFLVEEGQTLFMPGHLTHKVLTLEPYIGVGSFYIGFPNVLRTLSRWQRQQPNWKRLESSCLCSQVVPEVISTAIRQARRVARTSMSNQQKWGLDFARYSIHANPKQRNGYCDQQSDKERMRETTFEKIERHYLSVALPERNQTNTKK